MLRFRFTSLERVFTPEALDALGVAWGPIAERHQLHMGKLGIYFAAGAATLPIAADAYQAIQHDRAIERAEAARQAAAPRPAAAAPAAPAAAQPGEPGTAIARPADGGIAPPDTTRLHERA